MGKDNAMIPPGKNGQRLVMEGCPTMAEMVARWERFERTMKRECLSCLRRTSPVAPYEGHAEDCGTLLVLRMWNEPNE